MMKLGMEMVKAQREQTDDAVMECLEQDLIGLLLFRRPCDARMFITPCVLDLQHD